MAAVRITAATVPVVLLSPAARVALVCPPATAVRIVEPTAAPGLTLADPLLTRAP